MIIERHVRVRRSGAFQTVVIPREFELPGDDAVIRKDGERLILEPERPRALLALLATLEPLHEDFPAVSDPAPEPVEL